VVEAYLPRVEAIELVVSSVLNSLAWHTHSLLAHLALVHVTGGLVKVGEGCKAGHDAEKAVFGQLHVRGDTFDSFTGFNGYV
jgi:hypothetical protein